MTTPNRRYPLLNALIGAVFLIRGISQLRQAGITLMPSSPADAAAYGYALGYSFGVSFQLVAGVALLALSARLYLAARGRQI